MDKQVIIAHGVNHIAITFSISRAHGYEGQEFVTATVNGKKYRNACNVGGDTESLIEWLADEVKDNAEAQAILKRVHEADEAYTGAPSITLQDDGTYSVQNVGENACFQLLRQFGIRLKAIKSSTRKNAILTGYDVVNDGVEIQEEII